MVKLHVKKGDDSQFLCESHVDVLVDDLLANIVAVYNGRLKVQRICAGLLFTLTALLCTSSNTNFFIKILSSSLNTTLIVDKHCSDICCDEFLVPQIDHKSK